MRNPKWKRDEIILALDLYFKLTPGQIHARNPDIILLSDDLNKLPIHDNKPENEKFRNANGVGLKLSNFLAIDPKYNGKGMNSYSKLDYEIFMEYSADIIKLSKVSNQIRQLIRNEKLKLEISFIDEEEDFEVKEGKIIYRLHKSRERNQKINKLKKEKVLKETGTLSCEVCSFDFYKAYGELGKGFIECHHKIPLSEIDFESKTKLKDLALVCANCHRMLHRSSNMSVNKLKKTIIAYNIGN